MLAGDSLMTAETVRFGPGVRSCSVIDALAGLPAFIGIGKAMQNTATPAASGKSQRGPVCRGTTPAVSARPT